MSRSWDEEQRVQQEYFDALDRFDPVQHELDMAAEKITGDQNEIKKQFAPPQQIKPAHNTSLSERVRAKNLAAWILKQTRIRNEK